MELTTAVATSASQGALFFLILLVVNTFIVRHLIDTQDRHKIQLPIVGNGSCPSRNFWTAPNSMLRPSIMGVAFEMARAALQLADQSNLINERIAKRIIELAKTGELNPDVLCEAVLKEYCQHL